MSAGATPTSRARVLGVAVLLAAFAGGALSGAAVDRLVVNRDAAPEATRPARDRDDDRRDRRRQFVWERVTGLTEDQRGRIYAALDRRTAQVDSIWDEHRPALNALMYDSLRADIRAILTAEQRAEYDRMLEERRARRRQRDNGDQDKERSGP